MVGGTGVGAGVVGSEAEAVPVGRSVGDGGGADGGAGVGASGVSSRDSVIGGVGVGVGARDVDGVTEMVAEALFVSDVGAQSTKTLALPGHAAVGWGA